MAQSIISCADGRVNDPTHFLNFIDIHCQVYTIPELILFLGGCLMWVVAYYLIIHNARKLHLIDMAAVAGCSNFAWEFLWSFFFRTDMGYALVFTYRAWFFLDIYIFWLLLKYGSSESATPFIVRNFKFLCLAGLAVFTLLYYFFTHEGHDTSIGANSAYIAQMFISTLCLINLWGNPTLKGLSFHVGWLRSFGTGANSVFMFLHYPDLHFLQSMAALSFVIDMVYLATFLKMKKELGVAQR